MATYLSGVTDYIPQIQPFAPDINLYANVLQTKQSKYDANWQSLNNVYSQYFYADLSREDNQERRDELMKAIDGNLKKVSGLDLSLEQNVRQAKQLFTPFYEDKYLMRDMVYTKNYTQEKNKGLSYKNASNEKDRENYWDAGIKYLDYKMQEFKDADLAETLNFGGLTYTSFVNIQKKAMDLAKQFGDVESTSFSPDGRYMIVNRNGEQLREPLYRLFEASFGNDPAAQEMFQVLAYVNRKDYAQTNAGLFGGDAKQAEMKYLQENFENFAKQQKLDFENQQDNLKVINNSIADLEKQEAAGRITDAGKKALREYKYAQEIVQTNLTRAEKLNEELNIDIGVSNIGKGFQNPYGDIETLRRKVDSAMANDLFSKQLKEAAQIYSMRNMKQTVTADPYAVINYKHQKNIQLTNYKHQKNKQLADYKARIDKEAKDAEKQLEREILGTGDFSDAAASGSSGAVDEPVNAAALAKAKMEEQKAIITNDLNSLVNGFETLDKAGLLTSKQLYKITGYSSIESLKQAQEKGSLIKGDISFSFIPEKGKSLLNLLTPKGITSTINELSTLYKKAKISELPRDKEGRSADSKWYGFDPKTKKYELPIPDFFSKYVEKRGKTLDNIMEDTFDYLQKNQNLDVIQPMLQNFAGHANAPYQRYTYYKESKKAYDEWENKYIKPLVKDLAKTKTYMNMFTDAGDAGKLGRNDLYRHLGKETVMGIFLESHTEDVFYKNLEEILTAKYKYPIIFADYLGFGMNTQTKNASSVTSEHIFVKPVGLFDKLTNNLTELLETKKDIPAPPNIIPFGKMNTASLVGQFAANTTEINAQASDLFATGSLNFARANKKIQELSLDNDTYFAFNNTITGAENIKSLLNKPEQRAEFYAVIKNIINSYLPTKSKDVVNMNFSPLAKGSADNHSMRFTFPESYVKDFKDQFEAINPDLYTKFQKAGYSVTLVTPAGNLNSIPFAHFSQYDSFEQHLMMKGEKGHVITVHNLGPGIPERQLKFIYKDNGFKIEQYQNGVLDYNSNVRGWYTEPGSITTAYNDFLEGGFVKF
jgi:hypothetical protein